MSDGELAAYLANIYSEPAYTQEERHVALRKIGVFEVSTSTAYAQSMWTDSEVDAAKNTVAIITPVVALFTKCGVAMDIMQVLAAIPALAAGSPGAGLELLITGVGAVLPGVSNATTRKLRRAICNLPSGAITKLLRIGKDNKFKLVSALSKLSEITEGNIAPFVDLLEANAGNLDDVIRQLDWVAASPARGAFGNNPEAFAKLIENGSADDVLDWLSEAGAFPNVYEDKLIELASKRGSEWAGIANNLKKIHVVIQ